jgi:hypothetical protein
MKRFVTRYGTQVLVAVLAGPFGYAGGSLVPLLALLTLEVRTEVPICELPRAQDSTRAQLCCKGT